MSLFNSIIVRAVSWAGLAFVAGTAAFLWTQPCDGGDPPTANGVNAPTDPFGVPGTIYSPANPKPSTRPNSSRDIADPFAETEPAKLPSADSGKSSSAVIQAIKDMLAPEALNTRESPSTILPSSTDITELTVARRVLDAQYRLITEQIGAQAKSIQDLDKFDGEAEQIRSEIGRLKTIVNEMGTTLMKRKIELDAEPRVKIVQRASEPEPIAAARPYFVAGGGALLGLMLVGVGVLGVAVMRLLFRRKAKRDQELQGSGEAAPVRSSRWRKWAVVVCLALIVAAGLGALGWFLFPVRYESVAFVKVSEMEPAIWEQHSGINFEQYKRNAMADIKGNPVLDRALEDKSIQDLPVYKQNAADPINWLSDSLIVEFPGNGEYMRVAMRSDDPKGLKEIVDAVLSAFSTEAIDRARSEKLNDYDNLEKKFKMYDAQVLEKQRQLYTLSTQIGTADAETFKVQYKMQVDALDTLLRLRSDTQRQLNNSSPRAYHFVARMVWS
jgi:hypothetical protein